MTSTMPSVGRDLFCLTLFPQYSSVALLLWSSRCRSCRAGVNAPGSDSTVWSVLFGSQDITGNDTPNCALLDFSLGVCRDTKSRILHAQLGQAEKHRTLTNCAGMCAQHTARCQMVPDHMCLQTNSLKSASGVESSQNDEEETTTNHLLQNTFSSKHLACTKIAGAQRVAQRERRQWEWNGPSVMMQLAGRHGRNCDCAIIRIRALLETQVLALLFF